VQFVPKLLKLYRCVLNEAGQSRQSNLRRRVPRLYSPEE
jgi:hypothetical protein